MARWISPYRSVSLTPARPSSIEAVATALASATDSVRRFSTAGTEIVHVREEAATDPDVLLIDFPAAGQTTTDYEEFREIVAKTARGDLRYVGIALRGPADVVRTLTKRLSLLR